MIYFRVTALGCKVNQYEAQAIRQSLRNAGLCDWAGDTGVDLCVVHSCCITAEAARKSRQLLRRRASEHPEAVMLLSGCCALAGEQIESPGRAVYTAAKGDDLSAMLTTIASDLRQRKSNSAAKTAISDSAAAFIKPLQSDKVKEFRCKAAADNEESAPSTACGDGPTASLASIHDFSDRCRAFVKLQDGCDRFCSYCIIPHLRDTLYSRNKKEIFDEVSSLLENGYKELVLCGINLGAFGHNSVRSRPADAPAAPLAALLDELADFVGDAGRLRISSLDPSDIYPGLADVLAKHGNICPHLHLSLQSGSDNILTRMNRNYGSQQFIRAVEMLNQRLEVPAITTDIIAGFPGESDSDFAQTMELAQKVGFSRIHVFPFSPRPGTPAALRAGEMPAADIVTNRCRLLRSLAEKLSVEYTQKLAGKNARVLIENVKDSCYWGYCQRYTLFKLPQKLLPAGTCEGIFWDSKYE